MRGRTNGKVRRTAEEWEAIFAEFEASELSAAAFCRRKKLAKSTFTKRRQSRWKRPATRRRSTAGFVELTPQQPAVPPAVAEGRGFELELPGGVVLRWRA